MAFNDIKEIRANATRNYVLYNDMEKGASKEIVSALDNYEVNYIPWSQKERCIKELSLN